jgi:hypothetical protein
MKKKAAAPSSDMKKLARQMKEEPAKMKLGKKVKKKC